MVVLVFVVMLLGFLRLVLTGICGFSSRSFASQPQPYSAGGYGFPQVQGVGKPRWEASRSRVSPSETCQEKQQNIKTINIMP